MRRVCRSCKQDKPLDSGHFYRRKDYDGWRNPCIECIKAQGKQRWASIRTDPVKLQDYREKARAYYETNPDILRSAMLKRNYGISVEDYDALFALQGGLCAICGRPPTARRRRSKVQHGGLRLDVDHDHQTGAVRGLLCWPCNLILGLARDDVIVLQAAIAYLEAT